MRAKIRHLYEMIVGAVLSMLGFTSCGNIIEPAAEYGMPHATFKVIGDVKEAGSGKPIEGISVKFQRGGDDYYGYERGEFKSDKDGKVNGSLRDWPSDEKIEIVLEDVDGEDNGGLFARDTLRGDELKIEFVKDNESHWHKGEFTVSFHASLKKESGE